MESIIWLADLDRTWRVLAGAEHEQLPETDRSGRLAPARSSTR
jgi:hypothetical protein